MVTSFEVRVPEAELDDLARRLTATRWPPHVARVPWEDGTDPSFLHSLLEHWRTGFDWRQAERALNELPQFVTTIDGQQIHFVHLRGRGPRPMPLVLTNGWPSTLFEYLRLIPLLTDPARNGGDEADSFDVVIPSLPGYGFSAPPAAPGMDVQRIAGLWNTLMTRVLGYDRYAAHGSDIGAGVTAMLGLDAPASLVGIHVTSVSGATLVRWLGDGAEPLTEAERRFRAESERWSEAEGAYSAIQRTRPQSLAYAFTDSPAGLAGWIAEKYRAWSDCGGEVERRFSKDDLLRTISLYWFTRSIGPSMRLYFEGRRNPRILARGERIEVPCAVALFPADLGGRVPREWAERAYRVERWTEMPSGGHFPAHEEPDLLAADVRAFFRPFRP